MSSTSGFWVVFGISIFLSLAAVFQVPAAYAQDAVGVWVSFDSRADLPSLKAGLEKAGGHIVTLAPEGRLFVQVASGNLPALEQTSGVTGVEVSSAPALPKSAASEQSPGLGCRPATAEERALFESNYSRVTSVAPNRLSEERSLLTNGAASLPASADNSVSQHFPPIGNQGSLGACTSFATCFYYSTYTQARDEGINVSGGDPSSICSPAFMYPLLNDGVDEGSSVEFSFVKLATAGCCNWNLKPYDGSDWTSWPSEAAWVEALHRRLGTLHQIGSYVGCSDTDIEAIKQHLANGNIAVSATEVYTNWYSNRNLSDTTGVNNGVLFANSGSFEGHHAMTIVGYDDNRSYYDGVQTRQGAFLVANSWGSTWGRTNAAGMYGFMWVAYDFFKSTPDCFGIAYFGDDRPRYRPRLYAVCGLNHGQRGCLKFSGGVGPTGTAAWKSGYVLENDGGTSLAIDDTKRVAIDLTDGISSIADYHNFYLFTRLDVSGSSTGNGTITSANFYSDFDENGTFDSVSSTDPTVTTAPGAAGYATVQLSADPLSVLPGDSCTFYGPQGGPFAPPSKAYTLTNYGVTAVNWTAIAPAWLNLSKTSGTLNAGVSDTVTASPNASAQALANGNYSDSVVFRSASSGISQRRSVTLDSRPVDTFVFGAIDPDYTAGSAFAVSETAVDFAAEPVRAFSGTTTLAGYAGGDSTIGAGTSSWYMPLAAQMSRTQTVYLAGEIGSAGWITSLSLNVSTIPAQTLNRFTIRMKHTPLTSYSPPYTWESDGWTTVFQKNERIASTGWVKLNFSTPFQFNGSDNVMVDISMFNNSYGGGGSCYFTTTDTVRTLFCQMNSYYGDPLNWSDAANPEPFNTNRIPNVRFRVGNPTVISPIVTDAFINGTWGGSVSVPQEIGRAHV
mgnify:CR=1 FL=1